MAGLIAQPTPRVSPEIASYVGQLEADAGLHRVGDKTYFVTGYGGNINFIEGDDGVIVVNAGSFVGWTQQALTKFRERCHKPIKAVIYTHGYADHIGGVRGLVPQGQEVGVRVFSQADWRDLMADKAGPVQREVGFRGGSQLGYFLPFGDDGTYGSILSRWLPAGQGSSFLAPTDDISTLTTVVICGVELDLIPAPHDIDVGLMVWMPDERILFAGDVLMPGSMYPTISTPRFEARRDPQAWVQTMGMAASYEAEYLIPAYGSFVAGAHLVRTRLVAQQKLAQHLIDETYRQILRGATAQEIAESVRVPPELEQEVTYTELYHRRSWIVRGLVSREFGWFSGDPLDYVRHPPSARARRLAAEFGGIEGIVERSKNAYEAEDFAWAAELATEALILVPGHGLAREIRTASMKAIAFGSDSSNERNVLLTTVSLETGVLTREHILAGYRSAFADTSLLRDPCALLNLMGPKLARDRVSGLRLWVQFQLIDQDESFDVAIVDGVMLRGPDLSRKAPDLTLSLSYDTLVAGVEGITPFDGLRCDGRVKIISGDERWGRFVSSFEW